MPKAVVLLSGGLDSATALAMLQAEGYDCIALTVQYGQRHKDELEAARNVAASREVVRHEILDVPIGRWGGSALTSGLEVPKDRSPDEMLDIPITYVPARNTVMLALALALAEAEGAEAIGIGVSSVDYSGYPDCRPEYVEAFQSLAALATKAGVEGKPIQVLAPLLYLSKKETIAIGLALGVDYGLTHSCYDPVDGRPCGRCDACTLRAAAFAELGIPDPALEPR